MHIDDILKSETHTILDVRSKEEFEQGHVEGAINIPVEEIVNEIERLSQMPHPIVLCCESGRRSRQAHIYLSQHGIVNTFNGPTWLEIHDIKIKNNKA